jgi:hypothetical protein
MPNPALAAVTGLPSSNTEPVGRFSYDVPTGTWWWSTSVYAVHGFTPGETVPTTALICAHQHPDDRARAVQMITTAVTAGRPFGSRHRILDAQRRIHTVVTIGEGIRDAHGEIIKVSGYLIDVTDALHRDVQAATRMAVELSAATRATIEQAKGALMITYGLDEDEAFALLRWHSQHSNIKLRDIATAITDHTSDPGIADLSADGKITEILAHLTDPDTPVTSDTSELAIPATPSRTIGEALSAESAERLSA